MSHYIGDSPENPILKCNLDDKYYKGYEHFIGQELNHLKCIKQVGRGDNGRLYFVVFCNICKHYSLKVWSDVLLKKPAKCRCGKSPMSGKCKRTYSIWSNMKQRCNNQNFTFYESYGGRGIEVFVRWNIYENFVADMGNCPNGLELDRIDNEKGYNPDNCRWTTRSRNCRNRRNSWKATINGETKHIYDWAEYYGVSKSLVLDRYYKGFRNDELYIGKLKPRGRSKVWQGLKK